MGDVHLVLTLVGVVAAVIAVTAVCSRWELPNTLILILVGIAASYLPFIPSVQLSHEVVMLGLLPPLLYAAAIQTSLVDFRANIKPILLLSVGLVLFTAAGIAVLVHWIVPEVDWAVAFAIGAVVAPPDAVAATAIGRRIGLPRNIVTILEGESLFNDATALVTLNTARAIIVGGAVGWQIIARDFALAAVGGAVVGFLFFVVIGKVRRHITDPALDSALSFVTPFAAYVAAEEIHGSGVISVVVAGLLLGHKAPILQTAQSRIAERLNWRSIAFILEGSVFLLIGLQARTIIDNAVHDGWSHLTIVLLCGACLLAVIGLRVMWVMATHFFLVARGVSNFSQGVPQWQLGLLLSWAGMRGVVTLAAAFVIPESVPHRDVLLLIAFTVVAGTLLIQGFTLPALARRLRVRGPDPREDALARANLLHQASAAGLHQLDSLDEDDPHEVSAMIRDRVERRDHGAWERLAATETETPSEVYSRRRRKMLEAERGRVLEIRSTGTVAHEVIEQVLGMLDVEESMLDYSDREQNRLRGGEAQELSVTQTGCVHLQEITVVAQPDTPGRCAACAAEGLTWVHLRMCETCGQVGCCDSSIGKHATAHFENTQHPTMRSAEPGEDWRWCYLDEELG